MLTAFGSTQTADDAAVGDDVKDAAGAASPEVVQVHRAWQPVSISGPCASHLDP